MGGSIIFWPCACWIFKKNLSEILVCHIWGGQSSFDHVHVESLKKILGGILVCHTKGGQSSFDQVQAESESQHQYDRPGYHLEFFFKIQHAHGQKMIDPPDDKLGSHLEFF